MARIREDLVGVVVVRDVHAQVVTLAPGDLVPEWAEVGAHVIEPEPVAEAPRRTARAKGGN